MTSWRVIVRRAKARGIPAVGRGSAADSLVSYVLEISIVDPIEHDIDTAQLRIFCEAALAPTAGMDLCLHHHNWIAGGFN